MIYDDLATRLSSDYSIFLFALAGRYQSIRAPGIGVTPRAISDLRTDVSKMSNSFIASATATIDSYVRELDAESAVGSLVVRKKELLARLRGIVAENIYQVVRMAITGVGGVATLLRNSHGATGLLVQQSFAKIEFKASDSANRKWPTEKLFNVIVRDFAYQSWIDHQVSKFTQAGNDLMQTTKGEVFSLLGTAGYLSFEAIRSSAFHPNATSDMVPYVST